MRPLDFLGRIKVKLGLVILLAVAAAFTVNEYGRYLGVPSLARMVIAGVISLAMAQLLGRGMTGPLREMAAAAQTIAKGRYGLRVSATSRDEVGELARAFNAMAADLGEVDRQRRELVANVSHELRTPIAGLRAVLENVVDGVSPPDPATLGTALAQTERLGRLVAQLLDLSRLDSGARLIEPEAVGLAALCRQAVREAELARDDVTVEYAAPAGTTLFADPGLLAQVLANVLDNAVRHSPAGGVVRLTAEVARPSVRLSVTDSGPGIPAADRARVFERFSRLDSGRTADAGGAGLGLAIAKEIVELHNGSIEVSDGDAAVGCRMVIDLPQRIIMENAPEAPTPPSAPGTTAPPKHEPAPSHPSPAAADSTTPMTSGSVIATAAPGGAVTEGAVTEGAVTEGAAPSMITGGDSSSRTAGWEGPLTTAEEDEVSASADRDGPAGVGAKASRAGEGPISAEPGSVAPADSAMRGGVSDGGEPIDDVDDRDLSPLRETASSGEPSRGGEVSADVAGVWTSPGHQSASGEGGSAEQAEDHREKPRRDLSVVDTLASGIPVAAVTAHDPAHSPSNLLPPAPPPPPYGTKPSIPGPAGEPAAVISGRELIGGLIGLICGFAVGIVLAFFLAVLVSGGTALVMLVLISLAGIFLGSFIAKATARPGPAYPGPQMGPAPGRRPPHGQAPQAGSYAMSGPASQTGQGPGPDARSGLAPETGLGPGPRSAPGPRPRVGVYVPPPLFPRPKLPDAPSWLLGAAGLVGLAAAIALPFGQPGLGLVIVAVLMGLAVLPAARERITPWSVAFGLTAYAMVSMAIFRDADLLVTTLLIVAFGLAALALSGGGRGWLGAIRGGLSVMLAVFPLAWFLSGPVKRLVPRRRLAPMLTGVGLTVVLLAMFGILFVSADAVFSSMVKDLLRTPDWASSLPFRIFVFCVFAVLAAAAVLVALRPVNEPEMPDIRVRVSRSTWMIPLVALDLLFTVFVTVQITVLFGGDRRVLETSGLTYAEYARSGFFELLTVSVFVLALVAVATGGLALTDRTDHWRLATLLGLLCALTVVILISAMHRLGLYTDAYGLSRLRAAVGATIWWLAAVFVIVLIAGAVRLAGRGSGWVPRTLVLVTGLSLVIFAVWNPDLRVAETQVQSRGVDRLDRAYLANLGAEAVPALDRLPEPARSCVLRDIVSGNGLNELEPWGSWNLAREQARDLLRAHPIGTTQQCPPPRYP